jgi:hypothetical protein
MRPLVDPACPELSRRELLLRLKGAAFVVPVIASIALPACTPAGTEPSPLPTPPTVTITADRVNGVKADGVDAVTITVVLLGTTGTPVASYPVAVAATGSNNTVSTPALTDASGKTTFTVSSTKAETKTISATALSVTQSVNVVFV